MVFGWSGCGVLCGEGGEEAVTFLRKIFLTKSTLKYRVILKEEGSDEDGDFYCSACSFRNVARSLHGCGRSSFAVQYGDVAPTFAVRLFLRR